MRLFRRADEGLSRKSHHCTTKAAGRASGVSPILRDMKAHRRRSPTPPPPRSRMMSSTRRNCSRHLGQVGAEEVGELRGWQRTAVARDDGQEHRDLWTRFPPHRGRCRTRRCCASSCSSSGRTTSTPTSSTFPLRHAVHREQLSETLDVPPGSSAGVTHSRILPPDEPGGPSCRSRPRSRAPPC